ncbi:MAG: glucose-6-phosphate isomerase [Rhodospirillaceae bacterium]|nr:glucose-6-phosphate isomerase [Rhodospirillaceae bacterium]|tara:strand:+ start:66001 stop:67314 length:1314 start_codon:yes stop_codon:yes gene_type:complete
MNAIPYVQSVTNCLSEAVGEHGLDADHYAETLQRTSAAVAAIRSAHADGTLPLLNLPEQAEDINLLESVAGQYRDQFADVVILGTGGSSFGGQTLCRLADIGFGPRDGAPTLQFLDNVDPHTISEMLEKFDLSRTGFLAISKSGSTAETMTQFLVCLKAVQIAVGEEKSAQHFTVITEPEDNVLRRIAEKYGMSVLDHDPDIGGRYSALSLVGLLPVMIAGLDAKAVREGAASVLAPIFEEAPPNEVEPAIGAAIAVGLATENNICSTVLMPYVDRLADFGLWFRQLWAESLGKGGKGTTPINALGTVDQHSQLQLYLDGPPDKLFTVIMLDCAKEGPLVTADLVHDEAVEYLSGKSVGDLMDAEQRATTETLIRNGRPTRIIKLEKLDERAMGALMMHFMLETIIAADLFGVDPFDQPAVEEGKRLTREYLASNGT